MNDATLRRLSRFDAANLGPHATALYRELTRTAAAGLPLATVILAASIVDVVQHERLGPGGFWTGPSSLTLGTLQIWAGYVGGVTILCIMRANDGLMGETDAGLWLGSDAERAVKTLLDFLDDLQLSN